MNVIGSSSSSGGGGAMPSMDVSQINAEPPKWLVWIAEHKDEILEVMFGVATALVLWHLGLKPLDSLEIGAELMIILETIKDIKKYLEDGSWGNFGKVIEDIGLAIIGLGILIGNTPTIIAGAIVLALGILIKNWKKIKGFLQSGIDWLKSKRELIQDKFGEFGLEIYDDFIKNLQGMLDILDADMKMIKGIFDGLIKFIKGVFTGDWKLAWEGIKQIFMSIWDNIKLKFQTTWDWIKRQVKLFGEATGRIIASAFKAVVNNVLSAIERILNSPIRSINRLNSVINQVPGVNLGYLPEFRLPRLKVGGIVNMPRKRNTSRECNSRRKWSRRCYTIDR